MGNLNEFIQNFANQFDETDFAQHLLYRHDSSLIFHFVSTIRRSIL